MNVCFINYFTKFYNKRKRSQIQCNTKMSKMSDSQRCGTTTSTNFPQKYAREHLIRLGQSEWTLESSRCICSYVTDFLHFSGATEQPVILLQGLSIWQFLKHFLALTDSVVVLCEHGFKKPPFAFWEQSNGGSIILLFHCINQDMREQFSFPENKWTFLPTRLHSPRFEYCWAIKVLERSLYHNGGYWLLPAGYHNKQRRGLLDTSCLTLTHIASMWRVVFTKVQ